MPFLDHSSGNITIGGRTTTTTELGIHNDASTAHQQVDTLPNLKDILDQQKTVADATSTIATATRTYSQNQVKQATAEKEEIKKELAALLSPEACAEIAKQSSTDQDRFYAYVQSTTQ